ncbi:MAG: phosphatase PAP2 family protein [Bacteroidales bacterium]
MRHFILLLSLLLSFQLSYSQTREAKFLHRLTKSPGKAAVNFSKAASVSAEFLPYLIPAGIIGYGLITRDKDATFDGIEVAASLAVSVVVTQALKYTIDRKRPFDKYPGYIIKRSDGGSPSFPSGHSSSAASVATSLSLVYPKWYIIAPASLWALSVGYSRMQLGVHYPSDVAAGLAIGAGSAVLSHYANKWWHNKRKNAALNSAAFLSYQTID